MIKVTYGQLGFMQDAAFLFHFNDIVDQYEGQFEGAETVEVNIKEATYHDLKYNGNPWLLVSDDRKIVNIKFSAHKYYDTQGNPTNTPSPNDVFQDLHTLMKSAVQRYNSKEV